MELTLNQSDDHDDDSDHERTTSDRDEIHDPNLTNVDHSKHEEEDVDERVHTPSDCELTNYEKIHDEENIYDEERMDEEEEDEVTNELYKDMNVNLGNNDTEITYADQGGSCQQNMSQDLGFNLYFVQLVIRVRVSSILAIVDRYIENKLGEAINKAIQAHNLDYRQEALDEKNAYIEIINTSMRAIIKEELNTQLPNILPQAVSDFVNPMIEKNVTESLEAVVLARSSSQPKSTYEAAASISEFELTKILLDKIEESKSLLRADYKKSFMMHWSSLTTLTKIYSIHMTCQNAYVEIGRRLLSQVAHAKEPRTSFDELMDTSFDFFAFVLNWLNIKDLTHEILVGLAFELLKGTCKSLTELKYHLEECSKATTERLDWHNPEGKPYPFDLSKPLLLIQDHQGRQVMYDKYAYWGISQWGTKRQHFYGFAANLSLSKDVYSRKRIIAVSRLTMMKKYDYGHLEENEKLTNLTIDERYALNMALRMYTRRIVIQRRVEDLQLGVESYQKKLNITKPNTFSDGTLDYVRSALNDISKGIRMEYLPKRKWSGLDKRRARVMIQDINKHLYERRLMWNLKKFVGGIEYGNDLSLLERTI
nr:hypothetical protein [Tanacetum cinerariifolium]